MRKFELPMFVKILSLLEKDARFSVEGKWNDRQQAFTTKRLTALVERCNVSGLFVSKQQAASLVGSFVKPTYRLTRFPDEIANLRNTIVRELEGLVYLEIPAHQTHLWHAVTPFGEEVAKKFPKARDDIEEAAKCLALDRGTAAVFHVMCCIDLALQKFAQKLGTAYDPKWDWNKILEEVKLKIDPMPTKKKAQLLRKEKYLSAYAHLHAIRAAWRNPTMHSRRQYKPDEALEVFNAAKAFMRDLTKIL